MHQVSISPKSPKKGQKIYHLHLELSFLDNHGFDVLHEDLTRLRYFSKNVFRKKIFSFDPRKKTMNLKIYNWCLYFWFISMFTHKIFDNFNLASSFKVSNNCFALVEASSLKQSFFFQEHASKLDELE